MPNAFRCFLFISARFLQRSKQVRGCAVSGPGRKITSQSGSCNLHVERAFSLSKSTKIALILPLLRHTVDGRPRPLTGTRHLLHKTWRSALCRGG